MVPLPAMLWLFGAGLIGMLGAIKKLTSEVQV
ncbi:MAG: PEP-CTERM sorting domain-containing protein [Candidatus Thiodiazotropha sp. 6PLUC2]